MLDQSVQTQEPLGPEDAAKLGSATRAVPEVLPQHINIPICEPAAEEKTWTDPRLRAVQVWYTSFHNYAGTATKTRTFAFMFSVSHSAGSNFSRRSALPFPILLWWRFRKTKTQKGQRRGSSLVLLVLFICLCSLPILSFIHIFIQHILDIYWLHLHRTPEYETSHSCFIPQ